MNTQALRQKILDLAIRGKLVPQDPNDEPASVLLERIRTEKQQMVKDGKLKTKDIKDDTIIFKDEDNLHYEKFHDGTVKCIEDEIPFEIPRGWAWERLGNISVIARGGSPRPIKAFITTESNGINWIKIGDTEKNGKYIFSTREKLKPEGMPKSRYVKSGDFLLTNSMSFGRPYILKTDGCIHDGWLVIGNVENIFNQDYLYYALSAEFMYKALAILAGGSTVDNLNSNLVKSILFPIPSINEQAYIAQKVEELLSYAELLNQKEKKIANTITQCKSKILDLAIRGKLVPQDPNDEPASVLLKRIQAEKEELIKQGKIKRDKNDSVIFKGDDNSYYEKIGTAVNNIDEEIPFAIPHNWEFIRLKEAWQLLSGRDLAPSEYNSTKDGLPYITGASNFANGAINIVRWTSNPQVITKSGDLLLTCKGTVGEMAFNDFGDAHIARQIMAIKNVYNLDSEYLELCIKYYLNLIITNAKGLIPGISREDILNLILPLPPKQYQRRTVLLIKKIDAAMSSVINNAN